MANPTGINQYTKGITSAKKGTPLGNKVRTQLARDIRAISKMTGKSKVHVAQSMARAKMNQTDYNNAARAKSRRK